jgi:quercetin dioxygenase-like cupin family protein
MGVDETLAEAVVEERLASLMGGTMAPREAKPVDPEILARPIVYSELVQYQPGSVVSRTIIDKPEGTVTVFAFDKGQRLSTHSAPFDALADVVDGKGTVTIEEVDHELSAGQQIIMPANKPHAVRAEERFKMVLVMVRSR